MFGMRFGDIATSNTVVGGSWAAWDGSANGSRQNVSGTSGIVNCSVIALDSTRFLLMYLDNTTNVNVVVGSVSGTSVTYGAPRILATYSGFTAPISATLVSANVVALCWSVNALTNSLKSVIVSISGTTISQGSVTDIVTLDTTDNSYDITTLNSSSVFISYRPRSGSTTQGIVLSISGTAITPNTNADIAPSGSNQSSYACAAYTSSKTLLAFSDGTNSGAPSVRIVNISGGTSIGTLGTVAVLDSLSGVSFVNNSIRVITINTTSAFVTWEVLSGASTRNLYGMIITMSGNTITTNAAFLIKTGNFPLIIDTVTLLNANQAMVSYEYNGVSTVYGRVLAWSGTTISEPGSEVTLWNGDGNSSYQLANLSTMDGNTVAGSLVNSSVATSLIIKRV